MRSYITERELRQEVMTEIDATAGIDQAVIETDRILDYLTSWLAGHDVVTDDAAMLCDSWSPYE